jgi:hypothetical protein
MRWSKAKKALENLLAESVRRRVQFHVTRYGPSQSYTMARAWVTWDGQEIANFSSVEWLMKNYHVARQIQESEQVTDYRDPNQREGYYLPYEQSAEILTQQGIFSRTQFQDAVESYLNLSIESALASEKPIIQALAMLDRRLGRRRLAALQIGETSNPLVRLFYRLRCQAEDMPESRSI